MLQYQILNDTTDFKDQHKVRSQKVLSGGCAYVKNTSNEFVNRDLNNNEEEVDDNEDPSDDAKKGIPSVILLLAYPLRNSLYLKENILWSLKPILSQSLWYYGSITEAESLAFLKDKSVGTFLIRDSKHEDYILTLSFQTMFGTISLRIQYRNNFYSLVPINVDDNVDVNFTEPTPEFSSVISLIEFYRESKSMKIFGKNSMIFWIIFNSHECLKNPGIGPIQANALTTGGISIDHVGHVSHVTKDDYEIVADLDLGLPLYKRVPTLRHFSRLVINRSIRRQNMRRIDPELLSFLDKYPFSV